MDWTHNLQHSSLQCKKKTKYLYICTIDLFWYAWRQKENYNIFPNFNLYNLLTKLTWQWPLTSVYTNICILGFYFTRQHYNDFWPLFILTFVSWDSISLDNITMTSDPCSYTINQKSNRVECSGACVAINFGQDSAKS